MTGKVQWTRPMNQRLMKKAVYDASGCLLWSGQLNGCGYPRIKVKNRHIAAHRVAYEYYIGPIPMGLDLDHLCRVRSCINPFHLEPVTRSENLRRAAPFNYKRPPRGYVLLGECRQSPACYQMGCPNDSCLHAHFARLDVRRAKRQASDARKAVAGA